jgi:hypothetical protein
MERSAPFPSSSLHGAGLRALQAFFFHEVHALAQRERVEPAAEDAVAVEIDPAFVGSLDEAVIVFRVDFATRP